MREQEKTFLTSAFVTENVRFKKPEYVNFTWVKNRVSQEQGQSNTAKA